MAVAIVLGVSAPLSAQVQMPNPKEMSGVVLPSRDLPAGTVTVRVIRGSFDKNITGHPVEFTIDGTKRTVMTDGAGRAQVSGLARGARVRAATVVDNEPLTSQEAVIAETGFRMILVATDPKAAAQSPAPATTRGTVVLGPGSRLIAELSNERLTIYYALEIVNTAPTAVDTGGPLTFDLPAEARGATVLQGSSKQATAKGPRVIVTGPFAPGTTPVQIAYELPYRSGTVRLRQRWPAPLAQVSLYVLQFGEIDVASPQITSKQRVTEQGQPLIFATGPPIEAGHVLDVDITGLPHHASWPRYLALALAGAIMSVGIWAAVFTGPRRRAA